jgi:hypothetical protein
VPGPALRREAGIVALIILASLAARLLTWDPVADGAQARHVKTALVGALAATAVWCLVRVQTGAGSRLPLIAAVAVLLSGDAIHYVRVLNPIARGGVVQSFAATFDADSALQSGWEIETTGAGKVATNRGILVLESPPGATAHVAARLGTPPDVYVQWWLPVGLAESERTERLKWRARVQRTGSYYVVTELRNLLVQVVGYGLHVTYPDDQGSMRGYEIPHAVGGDGAMHDWELSRDLRELALFVDGQKVWASSPRGALNQLKLGETKADAQHGGRMEVESASYQSTLARS